MIRFWDQTLRDGEQSPGVHFTPSEKLRLAEEMDKVGIRFAEVGFPIVSKEDFRACQLLADQRFRMRLVCPARCRREDIDAVAETGVDEVAVFISTSPQLMRHSLRMNSDTVLEKTVESVEYARERGLKVHAVSEDTMRSREEFVTRFFKNATTAGAEGIVITDTVGVSTPERIYNLAKHLRHFIRARSYSVHAHDDLGLGTANTLAAVEAGFDVPQTTVSGIGERSGNAAFEEVCLALEVSCRRRTGIRLSRIYKLAELVEKFSGVPIPVHKPVIGTNSFSHEAGIHVAAMLRNTSTYEPYPPETVGRRRSFVLGKHSGGQLIEKILGNNVSYEQKRVLTLKIKQVQERRSKKRLYDLVKMKRMIDRERTGVSERELRMLTRKPKRQHS